MKRGIFLAALFTLIVAFSIAPTASAQVITATLEGQVLDSSGAAVPGATVTATNTATGLSRSVSTDEQGAYRLAALPVGHYNVSVEGGGFRRETKKVTLQIGQAATLDFALAIGELAQEVVVEAGTTVLEPTRTEISSVIAERQIAMLPVNGRQFIDFALLAPGVTIGETTSGSTDVIIEPVTKLSFGGQNIHFNLVQVDGADNISTASGIQKTTPSQEAVQEFRVINTKYSTEAGRAVGGIVNIISKSGTNDWHGSGYWFFRNNVFDAKSILLSPDPATCTTPGSISSGGCSLLDRLQQNQFGATLGGPLVKERLWLFANYEGQRRSENAFYNSVILANIDDINEAKCTLFGVLALTTPCQPGSLPLENLNVIRRFNYDQFLVKVDSALTPKNYLFVRYFYNDPDLTNQSPLNDGFELPSGFKDNFINDQTLVGALTTTFSSSLINDLRVQYARRFFDFVTVTSQPRLEVLNTFTVGVNRGNPDFYREPRFELIDGMTWIRGKHSVSFGGNFNWVRTTESFPLFYPAELHFLCVSGCPSAFVDGTPFVFFFQRNDASQNWLEPTLLPNLGVLQGDRIPESIRNLAKGQMTHYYNGLYVQDKWRATPKLTLNFGVRYEWEDWPRQALSNDMNNVDPRFGFAYNFGTGRNVVLRGGIGLFHGIIPSPLLSCQIPSCGGVIGPFPGRETKQDALNATTRLFAFASDPFIVGQAMREFLSNGTYPDFADSTAILGFPCPEGNFFDPSDPLTHSVAGTLAGCGFMGDAVIVRFADDHQAPYGIQMSLELEFDVHKDTTLSFGYLRTKGVHLGSFFDINQGPDNGCPQTLHDSNGRTGLKRDFFVVFVPGNCATRSGFPSTADPNIAVYFEADSRWNSVYDALLVNLNKRPTGWLGFGLSYTFSKTIDDGPNPSFVLIPQDANNIRAERTRSSDSVKHRFVGNATLLTPRDLNLAARDWEFGAIVTAQSPHYFTKFAGFDANGNIFDVNDRVGIEPRNTFQGDGLYSFDARISRSFPLGEYVRLQLIAEGFNLLNTLNVRFFNTAYGAADFCNVSAPLHPSCGAGPFFLEGSPNPSYGTPRAIHNPRQVQFAVRVTF